MSMSDKNQKRHALVAKLRDLAIEIGRTPTVLEVCNALEISDATIYRLFGSYPTLCQAAELDPPSRKIKKVTDEIFKADITKQLEKYKSNPRKEKVPYNSTLFIGDSHFPFVHKPTLEKIYSLCKILKPKRIVQMGDLYDRYANSKFPKSMNVYTPLQEEVIGREMAEEMWKELQKICPEAECYQILGNHDIRPVKRVLEKAPELENAIVDHLIKICSFKGVKLIEDHREALILDDVRIHHGYKSGVIGKHRDFTLMSTVVGHTHKGGVSFRSLNGHIIWELNCGFIGDVDSKALSYTAEKYNDCTLGVGFLDELGPRFIAL